MQDDCKVYAHSVSLNQDYQDSRIFRIGKYPENLKILQILIGVTHLELHSRHPGESRSPESGRANRRQKFLTNSSTGFRLSPE